MYIGNFPENGSTIKFDMRQYFVPAANQNLEIATENLQKIKSFYAPKPGPQELDDLAAESAMKGTQQVWS